MPLEMAVADENNRRLIEEAFKEMKKLQRLIAEDMTGAFDVTPRFSDNDGD